MRAPSRWIGSMTLTINIPEDDLPGFSDQARTRLEEATVEYATKLIEESNRIEVGRNSTSGPPEVTRGMVDDARTLLRKGLIAPRKSIWSKILHVSASVLFLAAGILYDEIKLQDSTYLLMYIILASAAVVSVAMAIIKE